MNTEVGAEGDAGESGWQPDASVMALARLAAGGDEAMPAFSICGTCGRRVEGTDKRKYCGRACANQALLVRRRLARARMIERLAR